MKKTRWFLHLKDLRLDFRANAQIAVLLGAQSIWVRRGKLLVVGGILALRCHENGVKFAVDDREGQFT